MRCGETLGSGADGAAVVAVAFCATGEAGATTTDAAADADDGTDAETGAEILAGAEEAAEAAAEAAAVGAAEADAEYSAAAQGVVGRNATDEDVD